MGHWFQECHHDESPILVSKAYCNFYLSSDKLILAGYPENEGIFLGDPTGVLLTVRKNIAFPGIIWDNFLWLNLKTNVVRMPMLTDEGVESSLPGEIIDNIFHQLRLRTGQGKLTPMMFVAPEVDNLQHFRLLYNDDEPVSKNPLSPFCHPVARKLFDATIILIGKKKIRDSLFGRWTE